MIADAKVDDLSSRQLGEVAYESSATELDCKVKVENVDVYVCHEIGVVKVVR